uniref:Uncharacterized protein n=1 Tax=Anguilla anguilla TaxID=7936 RepID=A0A0E9RM57_ANGAN
MRMNLQHKQHEREQQ